MLYGNFTINYHGYAIALFLASGVYLLWLDTKKYSESGMKREKKTAQLTGWINLSLGVIGFVIKLFS
ncbi:hypothetical protein J19TS2_10520 [Cohnella xylanilytica]|uniref:CLC_0170 family protein n=1 Tax=Cohnella xylanilytica TaxID=557555 RepID=UPI001B0C6E4E|nr:CLC_0170 family protein [Cohnella xylanilytica]GIO11497.1 hypothetical protein J19TS2_10520 [Cohnella xylanilytica]